MGTKNNQKMGIIPSGAQGLLLEQLTLGGVQGIIWDAGVDHKQVLSLLSSHSSPQPPLPLFFFFSSLSSLLTTNTYALC